MHWRHWLLVTVALTTARPERLPVRAYTPLDGLPGIAVHRIIQDSHGFLWLCTGEGISRFDGYAFKNYGAEDGLPDLNIWDMIESREGGYWVATGAGLCKFDPERHSSAKSKFEVLTPPGGQAASSINAIMEDPSGRIWVGTWAGLFHLSRVRDSVSSPWQFQHVEFGASGSNELADRKVIGIRRDREDRIWIVTAARVYLVSSSGRVEPFGPRRISNEIISFAADAQGRVWTGTRNGLLQMGPPGRTDVAERVYTTRDGLADNAIRAVFEDSNGSIMAGTVAGLTILTNDRASGTPAFQTYTRANGLPSNEINSIARDRDGNIWLGTNSGGAARLATNAFVTYGMEDGLAASHVVSMFSDRSDRLCIVTKAIGRLSLNQFDGRRFREIPLNVPTHYYGPRWVGWYQVMLESRSGEWWAGSAEGLLRFAPLKNGQSNLKPVRRYDHRDGLSGDHVHQIYEDSRGFLWISTRDPGGNGISRWDPGSGGFRRFSESDGLPSLKVMRANGFLEDRAGQIWVGLHRTGILRYAGNQFRLFSTSDGVPAGGIRRIYQDRSGRLWIGSGQGGIARIDNPEADHPRFTRYGTTEGLSGNEIQAITEDRWGRIYIGTGHGVDRLDPATGSVRWYTTADGLAPGEIQTAWRDKEGKLWFGTDQGVSSFIPAQDSSNEPPVVRIQALRIGANSFPLPDNGATEVTIPDLPSNRNHVQADYSGLSFAPGEIIRYQYRLDGLDQDWNQPTTNRSVIYAGLGPGRYAFNVRALNSDHVSSARPAVIKFRILPPFWIRWWFLMLSTTLAAAILYSLHRLRLKQVRELEKVRTRIAADLHDGIGASLSEITIAGELATRKCRAGDGDLREALSEITDTSRELVRSMTDIVWAIDPDRDHAGDLVQRMRKFASDMCTAANIRFRLSARTGIENLVVHSNIRREVLLLFKECIHNAIRHSGCAEIQAELAMSTGMLVLNVIDDGNGFDPQSHQNGRGLKNMTARARELGGSVRVISRPGGGTSIRLEVPIRYRRRLHEYVAAVRRSMR